MPLVLVWFVLSLAFVVGCGPDPPTHELRASGHVEATDVRLAAEVGGRIVMLTINEGDRVEAGALVVKLDAREVEIAIERAKAEQRHAEAHLKLLQAGARREDVAHAQGVGLETFWPQALALLAWGLAILWLATLRSSKRLA